MPIPSAHRNESGATMVEYAVALALFVAVLGGAFLYIERSATERQELNNPEEIRGRGPCGELLAAENCL